MSYVSIGDIIIDYDKIPDGEYLSEGTHQVRVFDYEFTPVPHGNSYLDITFKCIISGAIHRGRFWMTEKAMWRMKVLGKAIGLESGYQIPDIIGGELLIVLEKKDHIDGNGEPKKYTTITKMLPVDIKNDFDNGPQAKDKKASDEINEDDYYQNGHDPF